ncbi:hypothetical protein AYI68_g2353 [Smittium mucronatum]|uniref:Uncharacterized protein n=1 Tax=Smittium mucronatum TaxID=133383 RepID=A0A1R0H302_9FUNG|nr:hypothetical protein AYI68_g2353 [Smittium mucronatum]
MTNQDFFELGAYPYGFAPEVEIWRGVMEDRDNSVSFSYKASELGDDLNTSANFAGETVIEDLVSSLLELSLSPGPNPPMRFWPIIPNMGAVQTLSVFSTGIS